MSEALLCLHARKGSPEMHVAATHRCGVAPSEL